MRRNLTPYHFKACMQFSSCLPVVSIFVEHSSWPNVLVQWHISCLFHVHNYSKEIRAHKLECAKQASLDSCNYLCCQLSFRCRHEPRTHLNVSRVSLLTSKLLECSYLKLEDEDVRQFNGRESLESLGLLLYETQAKILAVVTRHQCIFLTRAEVADSIKKIRA